MRYVHYFKKSNREIFDTSVESMVVQKFCMSPGDSVVIKMWKGFLNAQKI